MNKQQVDILKWLRESGYAEDFIAGLREKCESVAAGDDRPTHEREWAARVAANLRGEALVSRVDAQILQESAALGGLIQTRSGDKN